MTKKSTLITKIVSGMEKGPEAIEQDLEALECTDTDWVTSGITGINGHVISGTPRYRQIVTPQFTLTVLIFGATNPDGLAVGKNDSIVQFPSTLLSSDQLINTQILNPYQIVGYNKRVSYGFSASGVVSVTSRNDAEINSGDGNLSAGLVLVTENIINE